MQLQCRPLRSVTSCSCSTRTYPGSWATAVGRPGKHGSTRPRPNAISRSCGSWIALRKKVARDRSRSALRPSSPRCLWLRGSATDSSRTWMKGPPARSRIGKSSKRRGTGTVEKPPSPGPISTNAQRGTSSRPTIRTSFRRSRGSRRSIESRLSCRPRPTVISRSSDAMNRSKPSLRSASRATAADSVDPPGASGSRSAPIARDPPGHVPSPRRVLSLVRARSLALGEKVAYDSIAAKERADAHADHFAALVVDTLREHQQTTGHPGVVVAPFDTELFGHWWFEGPRWLEAVLRKLEGQVEAATASSFLAEHPPRSTIRLPEGSWGQGGHHWVWLNDNTSWIS